MSQRLLGEGLILAFLVAQGLDGALTYLGIHMAACPEANPIIAFTMDRIGIAPALWTWKLLASLAGIYFYLVAGETLFGRLFLAAFVALYIMMSVLPWLWILSQTAP